MSADNYLLVLERKKGWTVHDNSLSSDQPGRNQVGKKLAGPFPTETEAMEESQNLKRLMPVEYGIRVRRMDDPLRAETIAALEDDLDRQTEEEDKLEDEPIEEQLNAHERALLGDIEQ